MQDLKDYYNDRQVKQVPAPPHRRLTSSIFWNEKTNLTDWKVIGKHLHKEGRVQKQDFIKLIDLVTKIIKNEPNLINIEDPLTVVGDIHGQYYDLVKILEVGGNIEKTKYLFLGDYVDRGHFSIETIILLFSIKLNFPETVYFLRGNHECRQLTQFFHFKEECLQKFDQQVYDIVMDCFDNLPLACLINGKFLALHGGLSPELQSISDIQAIDRFKEPPRFGVLLDILWSDPMENNANNIEKPFIGNDVRGCSYYFGYEAVKSIQKNSQILSIIRAHQAQLEGYKMYKWNYQSNFPTVITVFSAPNYCDLYNNKGAII